jgi:hypothetical protein
MSNAPAREHEQPAYLPGVENNVKLGPYKDLIDCARAGHAEYSKIWDLSAFQPSFTGSLATFSEGVLRTPATISPGMWELIAAWTSWLNECRFRTRAHAAAAAEMLGARSLFEAF